MPTKYVFGLRPDGRSDVTHEEDISVLPEFGNGLRGMDLWLNRETPADLSSSDDPVVGKPMVHEPPDGGAIFRVLDILPGKASKEDYIAVHRNLQSIHVPEHFDSLKDPSMHKTDTLNYFSLVAGELWALSEGRDVLMRPGDVIVQQGCMHGWRNDGTATARLICVLIDACPTN